MDTNSKRGNTYNDQHTDSKLKENKRFWFDWHLYPEEPIKIESVVEIFVFLSIVLFCAFLYIRWNTVPNRSIKLEFESLRTPWSYIYDDSSNVAVDSVRFAMAFNTKVTIPMTFDEDLVKDTFVCMTKIYPYFADRKYSELINLRFYIDSLLYNNKDIYNDSVLTSYYRKHDLENIFLRSLFISENPYFNRLDSLGKIFKDSLNCDYNLEPLFYIHYEEDLPTFAVKTDPIIVHREDDLFTVNFYNNQLSSSGFYRSYNINANRVNDKSKLDNCVPHLYYNEKRNISWYNYFDIFSYFSGGLPMETPAPLRLEDISQAYFNIKLKTLTVDSLILKIDFVGATEFSKMIPEPDTIGMGCIVYNDPLKIYRIRTNGLQFHARFLELENIQQIRVFTVTSIMAAFVIVFVVFAISAFFKIRRKFQLYKVKCRFLKPLLKFLVFGPLVYCIIYWAILDFYHTSALIGNLVAIPISLIIIILSYNIIRTKLKKILRSYFRIIISVISALFFIMCLGSSIIDLYNMTLEDLLRNGKYNQATRRCYNDIMSSDSITEKNMYDLRRALLGPGCVLLDSSMSSYSLMQNSDDNLLVFKEKDSLLLYYPQKNNLVKHVFPGLWRVSVRNGYIIAYCNNNKYCISRDNNQFYPIKFIGSFVGTSNNGQILVSQNYGSKEDSLLLYTNYNKNLDLKSVLVFPKLKANLEYVVIDDYLLAFDKDKMTSFIYMIKNQKFILQKKLKQGRELKIFSSRNNIYYSQYGTYYFQGKENCELFVDSLSNWDNSGYYVNMEPNINWDAAKIKYLKSLLNDKKLSHFLAFDSSRFYFFDENKNEIVWYQSEKGFDKQGGINVVNVPEKHYIINNNIYFVCEKQDSIYVYSIDGKTQMFGRNRWKTEIHSGFIFDEYNGKVIAYPLNNLRDSVIVNDDRIRKNFHIQSKGPWFFYNDGINGQLHVQNLEGYESLISRNKYLSYSQKVKLLKKLGYVSDK